MPSPHQNPRRPHGVEPKVPPDMEMTAFARAMGAAGALGIPTITFDDPASLSQIITGIPLTNHSPRFDSDMAKIAGYDWHSGLLDGTPVSVMFLNGHLPELGRKALRETISALMALNSESTGRGPTDIRVPTVHRLYVDKGGQPVGLIYEDFTGPSVVDLAVSGKAQLTLLFHAMRYFLEGLAAKGVAPVHDAASKICVVKGTILDTPENIGANMFFSDPTVLSAWARPIEEETGMLSDVPAPALGDPAELAVLGWEDIAARFAKRMAKEAAAKAEDIVYTSLARSALVGYAFDRAKGWDLSPGTRQAPQRATLELDDPVELAAVPLDAALLGFNTLDGALIHHATQWASSSHDDRRRLLESVIRALSEEEALKTRHPVSDFARALSLRVKEELSAQPAPTLVMRIANDLLRELDTKLSSLKPVVRNIRNGLPDNPIMDPEPGRALIASCIEAAGHDPEAVRRLLSIDLPAIIQRRGGMDSPAPQ